jgi:bifunctional non-homologous end joining protein LigD
MLPFIEPATPVLYPVPPRGADWLHEVEFDGWRVQLHKYGNFVQLYSRGGHKAAGFSDLVAALASIPAQSCVIEGEVVACNNRGLPDFHSLREGREVCVWAFDLLHLDAKDARGLPLVECKALLARLVHRAPTAACACPRASMTAQSSLRRSRRWD